MRLKVLTLNVAHGAPFAVPLPFLRGRSALLGTLDRVAALLAREGADVVALQEADRASLFSGRVDQVARIAEQAGYPHVHHGVHSGVPGLFRDARLPDAVSDHHAVVAELALQPSTATS
ncbi:endonuclease/exonuclease/phosphatase family protein [Corallococcus sp. AS-1-12]|uniref:endonuclease/exonuclease/phosphatase family protein n=1 Tax=Corallococcus sp. AS-1-12 TaxID=2874598 RepID=UPI001CBC583E|nr:endonuclease/exonuclease/phosphatase family protein [Corallococcus sp. AS-1-12]MBZ4330657.1 hypothetical protein [Corallococcus sp. AS-1-12]